MSSCKRQCYYACSRGTKPPWRSHCTAISKYWIAKNTRATHKRREKLQLQNRISAPKQFWSTFLKMNSKRKITSAKIEKICWQITSAALMRPLEYDLQCPAAKDNTITHAAAAPSHLDAAIALRYRDIELLNTLELRTHEQRHVAEHQGRTDSTLKRSQPHPPHTRGTFHRRLQALYTENTRFRAPASSPTQPPCNSHGATTMRFAAPRTHPLSHYNAIRIPALQNTKREPIARWNDSNRNRRTQEVPFIAAYSHFTPKNTRFRAPASSPTRIPCKIHAAITMRSATEDFVYIIMSIVIVMWCKVSHRSSQTTLHDVLLCHVKSLELKVIRNSEDCFPTSFGNIFIYIYIYIPITAYTGIIKKWLQIVLNATFCSMIILWSVTPWSQRKSINDHKQSKTIHMCLPNFPEWARCQPEMNKPPVL